MSAMPQLDFSTYASQVFWTLICFFGLYALFRKKFAPIIKDVMVQRSDFLKELLNSIKVNSKSLKREILKQLAFLQGSAKKAEEIKESAVGEVLRRESSIRNEVRYEVEQMSEIVSAFVRSKKEDRAKLAKELTVKLVKIYYKELVGSEIRNEEKVATRVHGLISEMYK